MKSNHYEQLLLRMDNTSLKNTGSNCETPERSCTPFQGNQNANPVIYYRCDVFKKDDEKTPISRPIFKRSGLKPKD